MSAPEHGDSGANPEHRPAAGFESTGLWPIDDPEQTTHIQRPPATVPAPESPAPAESCVPASVATPPPAAAAPPSADPAPHVDPEATSVVHRPTGDYTQPWAATTPSATPTSPAPAPGLPGYPPAGDHQQQYGGYPQGAGYQPAPGYPTVPSGAPAGYWPNPGHPQPQQSAAAEPAPGGFDFTPVTATRSGRRPVLLIGAGVAVIAVAAVGITGFWRPGFFLTRQLNVSKVQEGVQHILTDPNTGYGLSGVSGVVCNDGHNPSGDQGTRFRCSLSVNGAKRSVEVTVVDDHGTYQVGKVS